MFALSAAGSLPMLAGCGKPDEATAPPPPSTEEPVVTVFTWDEYFNLALLDTFKARTGIEVQLITYESSDEMADGLKSSPGKYDLVISEDGYLSILTGKRLIREMDLTRLTNLKHLDARWLNMAFDEGNRYTVPYTWGTTLLAWRKDMVAQAPKTWNALFDPAVKGKVSLLDERMECYAALLRLGGAQLNEASTAQIVQAADKLDVLVNTQEARFGDDNDMKAHLLEGTSALAMMYSGDAARIAEENPDKQIGYIIPEEGATVWVDCFCVPRDCRRPGNAYRFLDFMLEAESAALTSNFLRYATPNIAAKDKIDPDLLADPTIYPPPALLEKCRYYSVRGADSQRELNLRWARAQDNYRRRTETADASPAKQE